MSDQDFRYQEQPIEREPAWLTSAIDQDIQRAKAAIAFQKMQLPESDVILLMLREFETVGMTEHQYYEWNERCDGCRRVFKDSVGLLYCNAMRDWDKAGRTKVVITFAACLDCLAKP
jgi:hypothetical protein